MVSGLWDLPCPITRGSTRVLSNMSFPKFTPPLILFPSLIFLILPRLAHVRVSRPKDGNQEGMGITRLIAVIYNSYCSVFEFKGVAGRAV